MISLFYSRLSFCTKKAKFSKFVFVQIKYTVLPKILSEYIFLKSRLLKDHSEASGVQGTVMSNLRQKLEELENELRKEKLENSGIKVK